MKCGGVFKGEGVASVEDRLGFGIDGPVEKKDVGGEGRHRDDCGSCC